MAGPVDSFGFKTRLVTAGEFVFFAVDDLLNGEEPWVSDGTPAGTQLLLDIEPGSFGSFPEWLSSIDDMMFFGANGQLRKTDGTAAGTEVVHEIEVWSSSSAVVDGALYFRGRTDDSGKSSGRPTARTWEPCWSRTSPQGRTAPTPFSSRPWADESS